MKRSKKYVKRDYSNMTSIDVYNLVRKGELGKFPNNYLDKDTIKEIVRYFFLKERNITREELLTLDHAVFMENSMGGFRKFFDMHDYKVIQYCFPEHNIKPWEFRKVEPQFWYNKDNQKEFMLWVIDKENICVDSKEDLRRFTARMLIKHGGARLLKTGMDVYSLLSLVTDGKFKEWEIMKVGSWNEEKVKDAVKWLVEEKLKYSKQEVCNLRVRDFVKYNLDGMLQKACKHSILYALNLTYDNKFARDGIRGIYLKEQNN